MSETRRKPPTVIDRDLDPFGPYWDERLGEKWREPRESTKSLTAVVLAHLETEEGPVAIYGVPITDTPEIGKTEEET